MTICLECQTPNFFSQEIAGALACQPCSVITDNCSECLSIEECLVCDEGYKLNWRGICKNGLFGGAD